MILAVWSSMGEVSHKTDADENICHGDVMVSQYQNYLISSEGGKVVAIGIKDFVINTTDAVLVIDKSYTQEVKKQ